MSNFHSAYNTTAHAIHSSPIYVPVSSTLSSTNYGHRSCSSSLRLSNPKFNLDLYGANNDCDDSTDHFSLSYRSLSPVSSVIVHNHPVYLPVASQSPSSFVQTVSKLRQINDELCHTLAHCDLDEASQSRPSTTHVHHYLASPVPYQHCRSYSPDSERNSVISSPEFEPIKKKSNAALRYQIHVPRSKVRRSCSSSQLDQILMSTSDVYSQDDPMTIDLYPTKDHRFVKQIRNRLDNQRPWPETEKITGRNSYSNESIYHDETRMARAAYSKNEPIAPRSGLARGNDVPL
jgi:hypothetical protein